jgi:hypothetical protein
VSELEGELGRIVQRARRVGTATGRKSGRRIPVFSSVRGRRRYRILARPLFGNQHAILAITPQPTVVESRTAPVEEPPPEGPADGVQDAAPEGGEGEWTARHTRDRDALSSAFWKGRGFTWSGSP